MSRLGTTLLFFLLASALTALACSRSPEPGNPGALTAGPQSLVPPTGIRGMTIDVGGDRAFEPTGRTVRVQLTAQLARWELLPGVETEAVTYNGTVPGPTIRVTEGDVLEVTLVNRLPEPTTVHWHGVHVPSSMDGVPGLSQPLIMPGESFVYRFTASHAGTFMYHSHSMNSREQIDRGLYGVLIIDPQVAPSVTFDREYVMALQGWMVHLGGAMPAMGMGGMMDYNYFTINGKSYPATQALNVKLEDVVRVRLVNPSQTIHPMHLHGQDFKIVAKDGEPVPQAAQLTANTVTLNPGETYDIVFIADNPGRWAFHCHDLHHVANDGVEPGGLLVVVEYEGFDGGALPSPELPATPMPQSMPGMRH